jgi:serine/threonine protein phosphatase PrpC
LSRSRNEDCGSVAGRRIGRLAAQPVPEGAVLLLADGLGGHPGGDVASDLAIGYLEARLTKDRGEDGWVELIRGANREIYRRADRDPELRRMGTTIVGAALASQAVTVFHVGDSRAYLFAQGDLTPLTADHAYGGILHRALGGSSSFTEVSPDIRLQAWSQGDRLLLCTDGLTCVISDDEIAGELRAAADEAAAVANLMSATARRGAPDNVTIAICAN